MSTGSGHRGRLARLVALCALVVAGTGGAVGAGPEPTPGVFECSPGATPTSHSMEIPAGVGTATIDAFGAQGGGARGPSGLTDGGLGGHAQVVVSVSPGDILYVLVGCMGEDAPQAETRGGDGGTGNGGDGGGTGGLSPANGFGGGGGGGMSTVWLNGTTGDNIVLIAGGGGGAGAGTTGGTSGGTGGGGGGGAGLPGDPGTVDPNSFGDGGGQPNCTTTGGVGFNYQGERCPNGRGGDGAGGDPLSNGGGGGGGGAQGGGGGGEGNDDAGNSGGGGGGGSSFVAGSSLSHFRARGVHTHVRRITALQAGVRSGNGQVTVTVGAASAPATPISPQSSGPVGAQAPAPITAVPRTTG